MSLSSTMTSLMDKARANYHITDKLSVANLTDLMDQPAVNGPLSITYQDWTKTSGWGSDYVTVPVFKGVPICVTVEIKDIASTKSDEGPCLLCTFKDKNLNRLSYWDTDSDGNYKLAKNQSIQVGRGDDFSNKNGLRSAQRLFDDANLRNVAYITIGIGNNVSTTYSFRNLVVSYYEPYSVQDLIAGGQSNSSSVV